MKTGAPSNLPDMISRPMVFQEVERSGKQIKLYLIPDRKTVINSNYLPICFETFSLN